MATLPNMSLILPTLGADDSGGTGSAGAVILANTSGDGT